MWGCGNININFNLNFNLNFNASVVCLPPGSVVPLSLRKPSMTLATPSCVPSCEMVMDQPAAGACT